MNVSSWPSALIALHSCRMRTLCPAFAGKTGVIETSAIFMGRMVEPGRREKTSQADPASCISGCCIDEGTIIRDRPWSVDGRDPAKKGLGP